MSDFDLSAALSSYMGQLERRRAEVWGQMCRDRAELERGCVPTAAQLAAVADFRERVQAFYRTVGARLDGLQTCDDNSDSLRIPDEVNRG